ncbi:MAG: hydroxyacid dehydrogenase [Candidatus Bipolaricaulis sp.]|nr:hydroxyacid dehydrogenase [Candidatus Bipolaricaulis sp.]MDD5646749.1 hydroxyacid dehydrogenase [Candidatus Bipolaricaulis sp.]
MKNEGKKRVLLVQPIAEEGMQLLRDGGAELVSASDIREETLLRLVADCDGLIVRTAEISDAVIRAGRRLKVIARHGVGVDRIAMETANELRIPVVNGPYSNLEPLAEHAIAFMLMLAKKMVPSDRAAREGRFSVRNDYIGAELWQKTLGIVGVGRIGREVARKARVAFSMRVLGFDPYLAPENAPEGVELVSDLEAFFRACDFISLHCQLTDETRGMVGEREIGWMKPTAFLINLARGEVVDEPALVKALEEGRIAGLGTDVYAVEPPPKDHPFFRMDNVVLTPHMSAHTREAMVRMAVDAAAGLLDVLAGRRPQYLVNPKVWST